jgi:hypothetical protein
MRHTTFSTRFFHKSSPTFAFDICSVRVDVSRLDDPRFLGNLKFGFHPTTSHDLRGPGSTQGRIDGKKNGKMARRGQKSRYDDDADGWDRPSGRRVNGDSSAGVLNASSMTRELDELMRIIEADWNQFTNVNVYYTLDKTELMHSIHLSRLQCSSWIEVL